MQSVLLKEDLDEILYEGEDFFQRHYGARYLIFGASGFIGKWLVTILNYHITRSSSSAEIVVVSRDAGLSEIKMSRFSDFKIQPNIKFMNYEEFFADSVGPSNQTGFDLIFHLATPTHNFDASMNQIVPTARRILETLERQANQPKLIHFSSGAVYNYNAKFPIKIEESFPTLEPHAAVNVYQRTKLELESLFGEASIAGVVKALNPRLFAFLGPGFPISGHFAVSNFVRDAMARRPICIQGNPLNTRSYMYPTDLLTWTFRALSKFDEVRNLPLNFGSSEAITINDLAILVGRLTDQKQIIYENRKVSDEHHYVPSVDSTMQVLGVAIKRGLEESLSRWLRYLRGL